jgi:RNA polymerase sigma factor for flagellar operon FliA
MAEDDPAVLEKIASIIEQLSPCERLVVTLFFYEKLTLPEISTVLNLPQERSAQLLSSTMVRLRQVLRKGEPSSDPP